MTRGYSPYFAGPGRREKSVCNGWGWSSIFSNRKEKTLKMSLYVLTILYLLGLSWIFWVFFSTGTFLSQNMHTVPFPTNPHGRVVMLDGPSTDLAWRLWQTNAMLRHRRWDVWCEGWRNPWFLLFWNTGHRDFLYIFALESTPGWRCCCQTKGDYHCTSTIPRAGCDNQQLERCVGPQSAFSLHHPYPHPYPYHSTSIIIIMKYHRIVESSNIINWGFWLMCK